jgi:hypothetical protein
MEEIWKDIEGYEGKYQVSNLGRVKSIIFVKATGKIREKLLKPIVVNKNKRYVRVMGNTVIHRLVAKAFIPNPENKPQVNHKNGNKEDNRVENLEWATCSENLKHAFRNNLNSTKKGEESNLATITKDTVLKIRNLFNKGEGAREVSRLTGVKVRNLYRIKNRETWGHI